VGRKEQRNSADDNFSGDVLQVRTGAITLLESREPETMQDYSEKRDFPRMCIDCAASFRVDGSEQVATAIAKDLSGGGLLLRIENELPTGSRLNVEIRPGKNITPPLYAVAEVVRCAEGEGEFLAACSIVTMLQEDEVPLDFP
jgi:hypothetical protein